MLFSLKSTAGSKLVPSARLTGSNARYEEMKLGLCTGAGLPGPFGAALGPGLGAFEDGAAPPVLLPGLELELELDEDELLLLELDDEELLLELLLPPPQLHGSLQPEPDPWGQ